ncbi:uncharacterized protein LOC123705011 isoform X2 [Colias croceus]|uniref:uncharacterized protein LOC123705011 isoform X2 n=1 Tax=Colias crocea TaxID=72248 RepID=UPI001E280AB5|nr:uncharacterized protein LOC123705011 isoform X2 [Colias croceus]
MADDKELIYLMYSKRNKTSETQTSQLSNLNTYIRSDDVANKSTERSNLKFMDRKEHGKQICFNNISLVLQKKKKHRYKNVIFDSLNNSKKHKHLVKPKSSPLLCSKNYYTNSIIYYENFRHNKFEPGPPYKSYNNLTASRHLFSKTRNTSCEVYRCQFSTQEESCCCSCNSDAMFEVMKSLYDCYKKKNCDHCNCILCGHLPREERRLGELRKAGVDLSAIAKGKGKKKKKVTSKEMLAMLEGKTQAEKEKTLKELVKAGVDLPEPRTQSEEALMAKVRTELGLPAEPSTRKIPSEKLRKAKELGLLTPLEGKSTEQKEKILKGLVMNGIPLPKGKSESERKLIDKVRADMGLPPEPKTTAEKRNFKKAMDAGLITPLEGKTRSQKENILKQQAEMGIPLPEGRTASEKSLIAKIKQTVRPPSESKVPSEKMKKAKAAGLLTPLKGKTPAQKEKILKGLAMNGIPFPAAKTESDQKIMDKVRKDIGLPPEPRTSSEKNNYKKALAAGIITPLEGKSGPQKEAILKKQAEMGIPLPEGRTPSEKALIAKIQQTVRPVSEYKVPSEKLRKAKAAGLLTPLKGKTPEQKENILRGLAMNGIPLPEAKTESDRKIVDKVRRDLGLPPEPRSSLDKNNYKKALAAGVITPLEGKSAPQKEAILRKQAEMGIPLPEGRTPSEKALIAKIQQTVKPPSEYKVPSEKMKKAKAAGLLTPLQGKTPEQKEKILRGLAMNGIPLPAAKTESDRQIANKVRRDLGLPSEPTTSSEKNNYKKALAAGIITPLEGKSAPQKEEILRKQAAMGLPLPEGRTPSEKALIAKIQQTVRPVSEYKVPSEKLRKAKAAGLLTPLKGKTQEQKENILRGLAMNGIPLPEAKTESDRKIVDKVRRDLGLPPEPRSSLDKNNYKKALAAGVITPLEGKSAPQKEAILRKQAEMGIPLPEGRTPSEKALIAKIQQTVKPPSEYKVPSEKMKKAKAAGLLTPLQGKTPEQKEKILRGLAMNGIPLPASKTESDRQIANKVRRDLGLPPEPTTSSEKNNYKKALAAGIITPLEGKSAPQKEEILRKQAAMGLPLPEGRTPSEKALVAKIQQTVRPPKEKKSDREIADLFTKLEGKPDKEKQEMLKAFAMQGKPLPEGRTPSEKKLIDKVRHDLGLPPEPKSQAHKDKYKQAVAAGIIVPLEGKSAAQKEKILKAQADLGLELPEGRTASEKALIKKIKAEKSKRAKSLPPEKIKELDAKTAKVMKEGKGPSDECICDILTPESEKMSRGPQKVTSEKLRKAKAAGLLTPLKGKSAKEKERILKGLAKEGLPLPEPKTASEKQLIDKIKTEMGVPSAVKAVPSDKMRKAKAAGLLTPIHGKPDKEKEKILRGLAQHGIPLPQAQTASEKRVIDKVRKDLGLPPEPKTPSLKEKYRHAQNAGLITPLEGKSRAQKEKILAKQAEMGIPLPEGRTQSEKDMINKIRATVPRKITSEKLRKAKEAGLLTPLAGKTPKEKEKILRNLAKEGLPLPEPKTASEKQLIAKVRKDMGVPLEGISSEKLRKAKAAGLITPLEGKTPAQKEKILKGRIAAGLPLPEAVTPSDKEMIKKIKDETGYVTPSVEKRRAISERGILTPLKGKTPAEKEAILKKLAKKGIPLPEAKTASEKAIINKIIDDLGKSKVLLASPEKLKAAKAAGLLTPLEGKTDAQKEKILKGLASHGIPLPPAKTPSEKRILDKVRKDLGLPPEPKTSALKGKYRLAQNAGVITPLEGKSPSQKHKILAKQAEMGIPLPEGRTQSEKDLINRIRQTVPKKIASEKLRKAKEAGLLTPLQGKSPKEREKILKGLAKAGLPLPEGKTASEKQLINKIKADMGLPVEEIPSDKLRKAIAEGLITPLEGKSQAQKEKILRGRAALGLPLPEGVTPSDKALIKKVKADTGYVTPKKKRVSKVASMPRGPDITPAQKEKFLKDLAMQGKSLPEAKTASDVKILEKVKRDLGLPPEPKSQADKDKYKQAVAAGIIVPLEGKSAAQKEKMLKAQADLGLELPEGRTASEKALIKKIKAEKAKRAKPLPPEKIKQLDAKTAKVMKEGKGPSDECICNILTPESEKVSRVPQKVTSEKLRKAKAAGLLTPLQGKTPKEKEKILRNLAKEGMPLPEPKTASEKHLIAKVRKDMGVPLEGIPSEKFRKAKAAGLITPLEGKTPAQKEKILKGRIAAGLPLPEGVTPSDKEMIKKIKAETGYVTPLEKIPSEKMRKAKAAGLLTPLQGKPQAEKERILRGLAQHGIPLPPPQTASEKKLHDKVRRDMGLPPEPKTPSTKEKYRKALEAGLVTPLEGKTPAQKEKILTKLAEMGVPLPEGRTQSEKDLINRIRATTKKVPSEMKAEIGGKTIKAKTSSEKEVLRKAKAEGLLTPLKGKTPEQKEKILKGLAEAGLPMPEAKTASEKALIEKVRTSLGLPLEPTPSEKKGKIKTKSRKTGVSKVRKSAIGVGKSKLGITEEFQDVIKTTTCDRGCGCDRKKIRFKHSYVKIRVTSPDISSLCPCPEECLPGVKGGVFTDNEGIKVTVGQVTGVPSFPSKELKSRDKLHNEIISSHKNTNLTNGTALDVLNRFKKSIHDVSTSNTGSYIKNTIYVNNNTMPSSSYHTKKKYKALSASSVSDTFLLIQSCSILSDSDLSVRLSALLNGIDSSLLFTTSSNLSLLSHTISFISFSLANCSTNSNYLIETNSIGSFQSEECTTDDLDYLQFGYISKSGINSDINLYQYSSAFGSSMNEIQKQIISYPTIFRVVHNIRNYSAPDNYTYTEDPTILIDAVGKILSDPALRESSSLYVLMPTSSDDDDSLYSIEGQQSSTICIQLTESYTKWKNKYGPQINNSSCKKHRNSCGLRIAAKGRNNLSNGKRCTPIRNDCTENYNKPDINHYSDCLAIEKQEIHRSIYYDIGTDTTDRPCCCEIESNKDIVLQVLDDSINEPSNIISDVVAPFILNEALAQGINHDITGFKNYSNKRVNSIRNACAHDTPVRHCRICHPTGSHHYTSSGCSHLHHKQKQTSKQCECDFEKMIAAIEKIVKDNVSTACGTSRDNVNIEVTKPILRHCK